MFHSGIMATAWEGGQFLFGFVFVLLVSSNAANQKDNE